MPRGNPNWKFYPLTERSAAAIAKLSERTGTDQTTMYLRRANNKRSREARAKIIEALKLTIAECRKVSIRELTRRSGCSRITVRKHADLWAKDWQCASYSLQTR